jgi:hypothetical protein
MSLSSNTQKGCPVWLSKSPSFHYSYSNITKVLKYWDISLDDFLPLIYDYFPEFRELENGKSYRLFHHDYTKVCKPNSRCLAGRGYLVESNSVAGNLHITAGYPLSCLHIGAGSGGFAPMLSCERVEINADKNDQFLAQFKSVKEGIDRLDKAVKAAISLFVLCADSAYFKAKALCPLYEYSDVVSVFRVKGGIKVWTQASKGAGNDANSAKSPTENGSKGSSKGNSNGSSKGGAPAVYGEKYYVHEGIKTKVDKKSQKSFSQLGIDQLKSSSEDSYDDQMASGRKVKVNLTRWNNLLIRSKGGHNMKDKPFDLLKVEIVDLATGERVFKNPIFLSISGQQRAELSHQDAQKAYRERFDVEKVYRLSKQSLKMDKLQSPIVEHQDKWFKIVQLAYWLLYIAQDEIDDVKPEPWQKYLTANRDNAKVAIETKNLSPAQVQKALQSVFSTFDQTPFLPQKSKKGKGRQKGVRMTPRTKHKIIKKGQKEPPDTAQTA